MAVTRFTMYIPKEETPKEITAPLRLSLLSLGEGISILFAARNLLLTVIQISLLIMLMGTARLNAVASFAEFDQSAREGKPLTVAFLGGSLTWGAQATNPNKTSYRALIENRLETTYPDAHFHFVDAAIGGTGSQLAAFRLQRDVLAYHPDLVFLDFTVNDSAHASPDPDRMAAYESIVRRLVHKGIPVVQVILPVKRDIQPNPPKRPLDAAHKTVGKAYGLAIADAVGFTREHVESGDTTPDVLWDIENDQTHPGDAGYAVYAQAVWQAYERAVAEALVSNIPEEMLFEDTYMSLARIPFSQFNELPAGWRVGKPHRNAIAFDFVCSRWMDTICIAEHTESQSPEPLILNVHARNVMLFGEATQNSGSYQVIVDNGPPRTISSHCKDGNMRSVAAIATGLDPGKAHRIEIVPILKQGEELRIESICLAGDRAEAILTQ